MKNWTYDKKNFRWQRKGKEGTAFTRYTSLGGLYEAWMLRNDNQALHGPMSGTSDAARKWCESRAYWIGGWK